MQTMKKSILSDRANTSDRTVRAIGKIRPGIKVLTKEARENPNALKIYNDGVTRRLKFTEIDKLIQDATGIRNPSYPKNTQYFTVSSSDFGGMPEIAAQIVDAYGTLDKDGVKRLYRFPVVFHSDNLEDIYPNAMKCFGTKPNYESNYGEDGVRYCRYLPIVDPEAIKKQRASRIKKVPRREMVIRGVCDPRKCQEYAMGHCKFRGRLNFYIPETTTTGLMAMELGSEDAALQIWETLERIKEMFGRIPRTNPNDPKAHVFFISKVEVDTVYYDDNGEKKTGKQWVPRLVSSIDFGKALQLGFQPAVTLNQSMVAPAAWLESSHSDSSNGDIPQSTEVGQQSGQDIPSNTDKLLEELSQIEIELDLDPEVSNSYLANKLGDDWNEDLEKVKEAVAVYSVLKEMGKECATPFIQLSLLVQKNGIDSKSFLKYAVSKFGKNFNRNRSALAQLYLRMCELDGSGQDKARAFIEAEIASL